MAENHLHLDKRKEIEVGYVGVRTSKSVLGVQYLLRLIDHHAGRAGH